MIPRQSTPKLQSLAKSFPIVTLTGPRQSGKSTLIRAAFSDYQYVSLEDPDIRVLAQEDPRSFLERFSANAMFDEVQRAPELFSYIQGIADRENRPGQFILSGSQNFLPLNSISQSLAGRVAILHLLPLTLRELTEAGFVPARIDDWIFTGGYPRLYDADIDPTDFFPNYVSTYVDRDVREELGVKKIADFNTFLVMCAMRAGQVLNISGLANDCDISVTTAREWLSILESSFIAFRVPPYHRNYGKRLVKAPKLYFYDTGLCCNLLGIDSADQLLTSRYRGSIFENAAAVELIKQYQAIGKEPRLFYWRDSNQKEIDFIIEKGGVPQFAIEVKSSATYHPEAFKTLNELAPQMGLDTNHRFVIYGGDDSFSTQRGQVLGVADLSRLVA